MAQAANLQVIDLSSPHLSSVANDIRQACVEYGFFYVVNHGVEEELILRVFEESRKFFSLSLDDKKKLLRKDYRGYSQMFAENLDPSSRPRGDPKESFDIGNLEKSNLNQWPSEEILPYWRSTMEDYYCKVMDVGKRVLALMALALNLEKDHFEKIGALDQPEAFLRFLHYPGEVEHFDEERIGASAHTDYGMITLLVTNGVPGLQVCKDKNKEPRIWEDVLHMNGAFVVNIGDMMERWTNCLFGSTLHRVISTEQERFSSAFFLFPDLECIVECLESCCSESCPRRFPSIRSGDYLKERFGLTYGS